jgi:hypothetical protein
MNSKRDIPQWRKDLKLELAVMRDWLPTTAEMAARNKAVMECFDNPILDPAHEDYPAWR